MTFSIVMTKGLINFNKTFFIGASTSKKLMSSNAERKSCNCVITARAGTARAYKS